jgi:hypothetical protein
MRAVLGSKSGRICDGRRNDNRDTRMPAYIEMVSNIEKNWHRYFGYAFLIAFAVAYIFGCALLPQFEDTISEARGQRYVRA